MSTRRRPNPFDFKSITLETISLVGVFRQNGLLKDRASLTDLSAICEKVAFLPHTAFIRLEMQTVFADLLNKEVGKKHVLIGSPGVGKSVVFFLAALYIAAVEGKQVIYVRWSPEEQPTVFLICPGQLESTARIGSLSFTRLLFSLEDIARAALDFGYKVNNDSWRYFLDGPKEAQVEELVDLDYYLCTSGGYSTPSDSERKIIHIAVMSGWTERDLMEALVNVKNINSNEARKVYAECGGRMRLALDYLSDKAATIFWADGIIADQSESSCTLAITESDSRTSVDSRDRLRTMFRGSSGRPLQLVDSQYLLSKLRDRLTSGDLRKAYGVAETLDSRTMMGVLYEEIMHNWFQRMKPNPVSSVLRSPRGKTGKASVADLSKRLVYWSPSIPNFANIDAAFVDEAKVLHCIQYTIRGSHEFNATTFDQDFILELKQNFVEGFREIVVYFAVPSGVIFDIDVHDAFECDNHSTTCRFEVVHLKFNNDNEIGATASAFPFLS